MSLTPLAPLVSFSLASLSDDNAEQVIRYLEGRDFKQQSEAFIKKCFTVLKAEPYCLASEEVFSIINVMPRSVAEMHLVRDRRRCRWRCRR